MTMIPKLTAEDRREHFQLAGRKHWLAGKILTLNTGNEASISWRITGVAFRGKQWQVRLVRGTSIELQSLDWVLARIDEGLLAVR